MSIDARARAATAELRDSTRGAVPPVSSVVRRARDRRRRTRLAVAASCAALLGAAVMTGARVNPTQEHPAAPTPAPTFGLACQMPGITCARGRIQVQGELTTPISFAPTSGLNTDDLTPANGVLTLRRTQANPATGVTIFEDPIPVDGSPDRPVPAVSAASASATAAWLAARPFATAKGPTPATVGGLSGYRVDLTLRPGASLAGYAHGSAAAVTFIRGNGFESGSSSSVAPQFRQTTYYLLDGPHGLIVIWVWSVNGSPADLAAMSPLINNLHFG